MQSGDRVGKPPWLKVFLFPSPIELRQGVTYFTDAMNHLNGSWSIREEKELNKELPILGPLKMLLRTKPIKMNCIDKKTQMVVANGKK